MTLVTIPKIPILEVGMEWPAATGPATVTFEDLEAIVASQVDSEISGARLKIGHWDLPDGLVFAAEPALGTFCNYSIVDGITLEADLVGCPEWFVEIMPACFPSRSIEGYQQFKTQRKKTYSMVLTAVSLLGIEPPAITSLPDLYDFMMAEKPPVTITAGGRRMPTIKARTNVEDVRRAFYEDVATGDQFWWWIRSVELDPENQLIVDDDDGCLYRVPFSVGDDGNIEFSDPIEVEIEYNDVAAAYATHGEARMVAIFATAAESRPNERQEDKQMPETKARRPSKRTAAGAVEEPNPGTTDPPEDDDDTDETPMDDGDDDTGAEKPGQGDGPDDQSQPANTTAVAASIKVPKGFSLVPDETLNDLKAGAADGRAARKAQLDASRDGKIDAAVKAGKFAPAQVEHFKALWAADPSGTEAIIDALAENVIPVEQRSVGGGGEEMAASASGTYPSSWLTASEQAAVAARNGRA